MKWATVTLACWALWCFVSYGKTNKKGEQRMIPIICMLMLALAVLLGQRGNVAYRCHRIARRAKNLGVEDLRELRYIHWP